MLLCTKTKPYLTPIMTIGISAFANNAWATTTAPATCPASQICISETYAGEIDGTARSFYTVTNNTDDQIFAFAATNSQSTSQAYLDSNFSDVNNDSFAGWEAATIDQNTWDVTQKVFNWDEPLKTRWATGSNDLGTGTIEIGLFETLFPNANTDENVNFYWNSGIDSENNNAYVNALTNGVTYNQFYFYGSPESAFVILGETGNILNQGEISASVASVPEPKTYLMLLLGLGLLTFRLKWKQL